ncbi:hypothetical protein J437_LFUL003844 [Ladona fulva]|uniref:Baculoviral IAP repeat-containing protein 6 n=1 Tax=Ladona fulva TaxID=123851 RepID=A0A8K0KK68_LADFU|nr:hypothetical protein J437_LFUL003844 [Ladona fulva]
MQELKRQSGIVPALPVASAITERLNCLLPEPRLVSGSMAGNGQDRSAADRALMFSEAARRGTFGKWPHMNYKWALPDQMAQAGFYHQPSSTGDDRAMCFTCNVCLVCWEPTDEPWSEHERHSPSCPFVKGEYTQNVPLSVTLATSPAIPLRGRCQRKNRHSTNSPPVVLGTSSVSGLVATATIDADPAIAPLINIWNVSGRLKKEASYRVVNPINLQLAVDSGGQSVSLKSEGAETKESMLTRDAIPSADLPPDVENLENSASNVSSDQSLNESVLRMNLTALSIVGVSCRQNRSMSCVPEAQNTVQRALIVGFSPQKSSNSSANQTPRTSAFPFSQLVVYDLQHLSCNQDPGNMSGSVSSVTGQRREGARPEKDRSVGSCGTRQENSITAPIFPKILGSEGTSKELVDGVDSIPLKLESFISDYGGLHMQQTNELSDLMYEEMSGLGDSEASAEGTPETKRPQAWGKGSGSTSSDTNWPTFVQCVPLPVEHEGSAVWGLYPTFDGGYVLVVTTNFSGGCRLLLYPLEWSGEGLRLWEFPVDAKELYGEGLNPVEVNMLPPESEDRENLVSGVPRGFVSLICEDGILRVIDLAEMKVVSIAKPEKGKVFVSATYCNSLERLCACTNKGSLHFFVLPGEEEGESVREEEEEQFGKSWEVGEESMESSPSSPSPSPLPSSATPLLVHKSPLTLSDLQQLHLLTQFENLVPCYAATVPPCWLEMMQAQKQRRHPQHLQRGDEVQHTRSWRLLQDG